MVSDDWFSELEPQTMECAKPIARVRPQRRWSRRIGAFLAWLVRPSPFGAHVLFFSTLTFACALFASVDRNPLVIGGLGAVLPPVLPSLLLGLAIVAMTVTEMRKVDRVATSLAFLLALAVLTWLPDRVFSVDPDSPQGRISPFGSYPVTATLVTCLIAGWLMRYSWKRHAGWWQALIRKRRRFALFCLAVVLTGAVVGNLSSLMGLDRVMAPSKPLAPFLWLLLCAIYVVIIPTVALRLRGVFASLLLFSSSVASLFVVEMMLAEGFHLIELVWLPVWAVAGWLGIILPVSSLHRRSLSVSGGRWGWRWLANLAWAPTLVVAMALMAAVQFTDFGFLCRAYGQRPPSMWNTRDFWVSIRLRQVSAAEMSFHGWRGAQLNWVLPDRQLNQSERMLLSEGQPLIQLSLGNVRPDLEPGVFGGHWAGVMVQDSRLSQAQLAKLFDRPFHISLANVEVEETAASPAVLAAPTSYVALIRMQPGQVAGIGRAMLPLMGSNGNLWRPQVYLWYDDISLNADDWATLLELSQHCECLVFPTFKEEVDDADFFDGVKAGPRDRLRFRLISTLPLEFLRRMVESFSQSRLGLEMWDFPYDYRKLARESEPATRNRIIYDLIWSTWGGVQRWDSWAEGQLNSKESSLLTSDDHRSLFFDFSPVEETGTHLFFPDQKVLAQTDWAQCPRPKSLVIDSYWLTNGPQRNSIPANPEAFPQIPRGNAAMEAAWERAQFDELETLVIGGDLSFSDYSFLQKMPNLKTLQVVSWIGNPKVDSQLANEIQQLRHLERLVIADRISKSLIFGLQDHPSLKVVVCKQEAFDELPLSVQTAMMRSSFQVLLTPTDGYLTEYALLREHRLRVMARIREKYARE